MEELKSILETHSNYLRPDLPFVIDCSVQDKEESRKPFFRITPDIFAIDNVQHVYKENGCYYKVSYYLLNKTNLTTGPDLKPLVKLLKKCYPMNSVVLDVEICPYEEEIVLCYEVLCSCIGPYSASFKRDVKNSRRMSGA